MGDNRVGNLLGKSCKSTKCLLDPILESSYSGKRTKDPEHIIISSP